MPEAEATAHRVLLAELVAAMLVRAQKGVAALQDTNKKKKHFIKK